MAISHKSWCGLFFVACSAIATAVHADASAIAVGSDEFSWWVNSKTQQQASKEALAGCNKTSVHKDCKLAATKAIAQAKGGGRTSWGRSDINLDEAKQLALEGCGSASCRVTQEIRVPGFYSLAKAIPDKDGGTSYFLIYGHNNFNEATKEALQNCEERAASGKCQILWSGAIAGNHKVASAPKAERVSERSCRPQTPTVRCSSQCANGNCIIAYENGCKIRVHVQPIFDGMTNLWTYPSPSC